MKIVIDGEDKKYYIKKPKGWNPCILGNKAHRDKELNVLPNCVGWATGRFNQLGAYGECKYLGNHNAEDFIKFVKSQKLDIGQTPKIGACMVWKGKGELAGHVAIVEDVISKTEVSTSESGWSSTKAYWEQTRKKGLTNRWGMGSKYSFLGFIYNPNVYVKIKLPNRGYFKKGDKGEDVSLINQWLFEKYANKKVLGNLYGTNTVKYVKEFQKNAKKDGIYNDNIDGCIGKKTLEAMRIAGFKH